MIEKVKYIFLLKFCKNQNLDSLINEHILLYRNTVFTHYCKKQSFKSIIVALMLSKTTKKFECSISWN